MKLKILLKKYKLYLTNYEAYKNYKYLLKLQQSNISLPKLDIEPLDRNFIRFKHSGNIGDIIYALPTIYSLAKNYDIHLFFGLNLKGNYGKNHHPLGNNTMNNNMVEMLSKLLLTQPKIKVCEAYIENSAIDYDLDLFRNYPFPKQGGNIARWYFYVFGINADLGQAWLKVIPNEKYRNSIIIARSVRYNAPGIDYSFLKKYSNTFFVGIDEEFYKMQKKIPNIELIKVSNFLEMAEAIAACKLFIGNQSFPFALAEALKVKRLLELYHLSPNVIPEGVNGYDFCYQPQFEYLTNKLLEN